MLTPHERQELAAIERGLTAGDPVLSRSLGEGRSCRRVNRPALRCAVAVAGLALLAAGLVAGSFAALFASCQLLSAAATLHVSRPGQDATLREPPARD